MKGKKLLDSDPESLDDEDLEIQIGAQTEELQKLNTELEAIDRTRDKLVARFLELTDKRDVARNTKKGRGNGQGNGPNT